MDAADLDKENFLAWYRKATPEDMELARRHGAERLDEMLVKYSGDVRIINVFKRIVM